MTKIDDSISKMTLEEKAALCTGAGPWTTNPVERLGLPEITLTDGPHGVRRVSDVHGFIERSLPATCFPTATCLASTWDVDLLHQVGEAIAMECLAQDVDVILGPGVNMKRIPHCGRNFEYYSEDPFMAGKLAASFINGMQSKGVGTSLKHYAANNQEYQRSTISSEVDERTLREIYLPAFEMAVKEAQPWTVMCSYNKVNGTYAAENHWLLTELLREEWGFQNLVVSDWGAVHDRVEALKAGLDLEMPGPRPLHVNAIVEEVRSGKLDEAVLDQSVRRILQIIFKASQTPKGGALDIAAQHALARQVAAQGMVLLKNNGLLPLTHPQHIAVIGRAAKEAYCQGGGSSHVNPTRVDEPLAELQALAGETQLTYCEGYRECAQLDQALIDEACQAASQAEVALLYISLGSTDESEGFDRPNIDLSQQQVALIKAVSSVQHNTVVILNNGAPVVMGEWVDRVAAVLEAWMMGQAGGGAIADILFGMVNPSGKLPESFPRRLEDTPAFINYPGENGRVRYGEGLFIGYRYYDMKQAAPQFPFGHGLSYTTFSYTNPRVSAQVIKDVDGLTVWVDVTNTGPVPGKEIVQVYVHDRKSSLVRPPKELKGFARVELQPGETKAVEVTLDFRAFAFYHPGYRRWITENGEFDILIGSSSTDIRCTQTITLQSTLELPSLLNRDSTLREWLDDPIGLQVLAPHIEQVKQEVYATFDLDNSDDIGMDPMNYIMDSPLLGVLSFLSDILPESPEVMVEGFLQQVHQAQ